MGQVGRDFETFAGADFDGSAAEVKYQASGMDHGHLFIDVLVTRDVSTLFQLELRDGHAAGVHDPADELGIHFLARNAVPFV